MDDSKRLAAMERHLTMIHRQLSGLTILSAEILGFLIRHQSPCLCLGYRKRVEKESGVEYVGHAPDCPQAILDRRG